MRTIYFVVAVDVDEHNEPVAALIPQDVQEILTEGFIQHDRGQQPVVRRVERAESTGAARYRAVAS